MMRLYQSQPENASKGTLLAITERIGSRDAWRRCGAASYEHFRIFLLLMRSPRHKPGDFRVLAIGLENRARIHKGDWP